MSSNINGNRKRKKNYSSLKTYIFRLLKKEHPGISISKASLIVLDSMMVHLLDKITDECRTLTNNSGQSTITTKRVNSAFKLLFGRNGELIDLISKNSLSAIETFEENSKIASTN